MNAEDLPIVTQFYYSHSSLSDREVATGDMAATERCSGSTSSARVSPRICS